MPNRYCIFLSPQEERVSGEDYHTCEIKRALERESVACVASLFTNDYGDNFVNCAVDDQLRCPAYTNDASCSGRVLRFFQSLPHLLEDPK